MTNFKGTKGKWYMSTSPKGNHFINVSGNYEFIKVYSGGDDEIAERQKYNALLISRAPEMLEMLERILGPLEAINIDPDMCEEIKQLIKSTTEL